MPRLAFIQFYPNDWLAEPSIRACSVAARGLWIDMLSLMHLSPRRGYLLSATGSPLSQDQLARLTGCSSDEASRLMAELRSSGCFSCTDDGTIYSRRMVRDEDKRQACSEAGKRGGGNPTFKGHPKGGSKGSPKGDLKPPETIGQKPESRDPPHPPAGGMAGKPPSARRRRKPPGEPVHRERNPLFDAVATVTGADRVTAGGLIGDVTAILAAASPPYSPDDVFEFGQRYRELCPWGPEKGRHRPTPKELQSHIGGIRAKPLAKRSDTDAGAETLRQRQQNEEEREKAAPPEFVRKLVNQYTAGIR